MTTRPPDLTSFNLDEMQKQFCISAFQQTNNLGEAAKLLGITPIELQRLAAKHHITPLGGPVEPPR